MLHAITQKWQAPLVRGIVDILFGLMLIMSPVFSLFTIAIFFGILTFGDAVVGIVHGIAGGERGKSWWEMILLGLLGLAAGLITIFWPHITILIMLYIIAWWAIFRGIFEIIAAVRLRKVIQGEWFLLLSGTAAIGFGFIIFFSPRIGALSLMLILGWYMIWLGLLSISFAFELRRVHKTLTLAHAH